jgi:saccharopine dehydrogenase-like NADP-dependent oxidoreductase
MTLHTIALFGSGKIGECIVGLLSRSGRYAVRVCDGDITRAQRIANQFPNSTAFHLDLDDERATLNLLKGAGATISALPFSCNVRVANLAKQAGVHYFDLTEDVATSSAIEVLSQGSSTVFMPQCGLAPGFISIAAADLMRSFDSVDTVKMRVGALPTYPSNRMKYNLTWSTDGLINEYCNLCEAIIDGKRQKVLPLEGYERFSLDGQEYEAFNTSGGLGTLCDSVDGKVRSLDYKSVRYPGHRDLIAFLMNDLRFQDNRAELKKIFERAIPSTRQDKCVIFVQVTGTQKGQLLQKAHVSTVYDQFVDSNHFGAIQVTTASGICVPLDLVLTGNLGADGGFVKSEQISLQTFLDHEFGVFYRSRS